MATKLDKETLIKQRFWFLLPAVALFLLSPWISLMGIGSPAEDKHKTDDATYNTLKGISVEQKLKNQPWIDAMAKEVSVSGAKTEELWYTEYNRQNSVVRDPKDPLKGEIKEMKTRFITWP